MLNIPKENKKAFIKVAIVIVLIIIITVFFDVNFMYKNVFTPKEPDLTVYGNTAESKVEANKYEIVSEPRRILFYTDEIMAMINNKEFEKLYSILDEEYRSIYASSLDEFKERMAKFDNGEYVFSYDEYFKEGSMFLIDARFEKINKTRDDIINGEPTIIDTVCIKEIEKGKYTVAFSSFIDKIQMNIVASNNLIKVKIKEMILKANSTELVINIENLTDEVINLRDDRLSVALSHSIAYRYFDPNTMHQRLQPKSDITFKLKFKNIYCQYSRPKGIKFYDIYGSDGKRQQLYIDF